MGGGAAALVMAVGIGAWIRRRQWRRVSRETVKGGLEVNLFERIEKLEEDLRSSVTIVRVLSRQLEKLGIRFRVTRKALKEPIAEVVFTFLVIFCVCYEILVCFCICFKRIRDPNAVDIVKFRNVESE